MIGLVGAGIAAVWLAACGTTGSTALRTGGVGPTANQSTSTQTVRVSAMAFDVPVGWPVYDLASDHLRCVRLDVHAVYLGHQGVDAGCPARVVGRTESVHIEPLDQSTGLTPSGSGARQSVHGHDAFIQPFGDINHQVVVRFPADGVLVTLTYASDRAAADRILASARSAP